MSEAVKSTLEKLIHLAYQVAKASGAVQLYRPQCTEIKTKAEHLAFLLRQAARSDLYDRPAARVTEATAEALSNALSLVSKCRDHCRIMQRLCNIIPSGSFLQVVAQLDSSIENMSDLIRISSQNNDPDGQSYLDRFPNIAQNEPVLFLIWDHITRIPPESRGARDKYASILDSMVRDNEHNARKIIEEYGVVPLVHLLKYGRDEGREAAARALGYLAHDKELVADLVQAGICSALAKSLEEPPMNVQATVSWAIGELCAKNPDCQDFFAQNHVVPLLVGHIAFETNTIQEHSKYSVLAMPSIVQSAMVTNGSLGVTRGHLSEDANMIVHLKARAASALCSLAKGNDNICKSITQSRGLLCFAILLEKGTGDVQYFSAMAIMEIARVAKHNLALRQSAFGPSSPATKDVVEQLLRIVRNECDELLLLPCITSLGCLARTFLASNFQIVGPLVQLLDDRESAVTKEALIALAEFARTENHLHATHCKAIIEAGGELLLVQLVYFNADQWIQIEALILLCYLALHVPDSEELAQAEVGTVLTWAAKQTMVLDDRVEILLPEARARVGGVGPKPMEPNSCLCSMGSRSYICAFRFNICACSRQFPCTQI